MKPITVLAIPDAHTEPGQDLSRFKAVANLTLELAEECLRRDQELVVVQQGDWADWGSLGMHDEGTHKGMAGRILEDLAALKESQTIYHEGLQGINVRKYFTEGNHGTPRLHRLENRIPAIKGLLDPVKDALFEEHGWEVLPFLEPLDINGVLFAHYFTGGVMGRAIGGRNMAKNMASQLHMSCVAGHSHVMGMNWVRRPDGTWVQTMSTGVFCDPNSKVFQSWNAAGARHYWPGCVILRNIQQGSYDPQTVGLDYLMKHFL